MNEKNILVTGGFGFVGSHLVERLLTEGGAGIHVVDNLASSPIDPEAFVRKLGHPRQLTFDLMSIEDYFKRGGGRPHFDEIYHLASIVGPVGVLGYAGRIVKQITEDTYRLIEVAMSDHARLCDVSTSEVYGGGRDGYCSENDTKIIPAVVSVRLEYAVAKLACEIALINTSRVSDLSAVIVRPFNIAGPRQSAKGGFVLPRFIGQALSGAPLTVYGTGRSIRAFTHVADVADGIVRAVRRGSPGEAYNLGNPANKVHILELAERVIRITGTRSRTEFVDPKVLFGPLFEEANDKYPDSDRAMRELGWRPQYDLDEIIRQTVEYSRAERRD
jgi:nucleoside-diphosphate-sugar epimerase